MSKHICNFYGVEVTQMVVTELSWQSFHTCAGQVPTLPAEMWKLCQSIGWMVDGSKDAHNIPKIVHDPLVHCTDWQSFHLCAGHVSSLPAPGNQANHIREHPGCYSMDHSSDVLHRWVI